MYLKIPNTCVRLYDGTVVLLSRFPNVRWIVHNGWYTYQNEQRMGWYFNSIPANEVIPVSDEDLQTCIVVDPRAIQPCPPCPPCPPVPPCPPTPEEEVAELQQQVQQIINDIYWKQTSSELWDQGTLSFATGVEIESESAIRTSILPSGITDVAPVSGYRVEVFAYDNAGNYQGIWNGESLEPTPYYFVDTANLSELQTQYQLRLVLSSTDSEEPIQPDDGTNLVLYRTTDPTLTQSNVAADAGATGEAINAIISQIATLPKWEVITE